MAEFWDEWRGSLDGRPTMLIKRVLKLPFWRRAGKVLSLRLDLHKFIGEDDAGCYHSHPAWAVRVVLWGGYVEATYDGDVKPWRPGMVGIIAPSFAHRVSALLNGRSSYSLWLRGPICADVKLLGWGWAEQRAGAVDRGTAPK